MYNRLVRFLIVAAIAATGVPAVATACVSDDDCSAPTPICDSVQCIECLLDLDCPTSSAPRCDSAAGTCAGCLDDSSCTVFPALPACGGSGACAECSASNASLCSGNTPVCDTAAGACAPCAGNADCASAADGPVCLPGGACGADSSGCDETARADCSPSGVSTIRVANSGVLLRNGIQWKWLRGFAEVESFGDPMLTSNYSLCMYRDASVIFEARLAADASRWKWTGDGFRYRNEADEYGIHRVLLKSGQTDAKILVKGGGYYLQPPELPIQGSSVVVQLVRQDGGGSACWEAAFVAPYALDTFPTFRDTASQ